MIEKIVPQASSYLKEVYQEQKDICWGHFLRGQMSMAWVKFINFEIHQQQREVRKRNFDIRVLSSGA